MYERAGIPDRLLRIEQLEKVAWRQGPGPKAILLLGLWRITPFQGLMLAWEGLDVTVTPYRCQNWEN